MAKIISWMISLRGKFHISNIFMYNYNFINLYFELLIMVLIENLYNIMKKIINYKVN